MPRKKPRTLTVQLHRAQQAFRRSDALFRCLVGGRGAGKTWIGAYDLLRRCRPGRTYLAVSPTYTLLDDTTLPTFISLARRLGTFRGLRVTPRPMVRIACGAGKPRARVRFRSAEEPDKLRGPNLSGSWLDEASLMHVDVYAIVIAALREAGEQGWLSATMTPKGIAHWTYETFGTGRPDVACFQARTGANPFLPAGFQDRLASQYGGISTAFARQELLGEWVADDDGWQVIPTGWVVAAQARWTPRPPGDTKLSCLGVDVAYGGADRTVIVPRYGTWFGQPRAYAGEATDSGSKACALVLLCHQDDAPIHVDAIGYGAAAHEHLRQRVHGLAVAVNVARPSGLVDRSRKYPLTNIRSAAYWLLREALDPETGDDLALPPGREVLADLTAPRFSIRASGIAVEPKEDIRERLGRSPDVGDAIALAHYPLGRAGAPEGLPDPPRRDAYDSRGPERLARRGMFGMEE